MSIDVQHENRIVSDSLDHQAEPFFALAKVLFHPVSLGDVSRGGYQPVDGAIVAEKRAGGEQKVPPGTIGMRRTELDLSLTFLALNHALEQCVQLGLVLRVRSGAKYASDVLLRLPTEDSVHVIADIQEPRVTI